MIKFNKKEKYIHVQDFDCPGKNMKRNGLNILLERFLKSNVYFGIEI